MCSVTGLNWDDPSADAVAKEIKRQTLLELVDHCSSPAGQKVLTEATYTDVVAMVAANISRALPSSAATGGADSEEGGGAGGAGGAGVPPA